MKYKGDKILAQSFGDNNHANKNINKIILPKSITAIEKEDFIDCIGLTGNLIIPNGVTTIGNMLFLLALAGLG